MKHVSDKFIFRMRVLVLLVCLAAAACAEKARFDNYSVYRVVPTTQEQLDAIRAIQNYPDGLSFWTEAVAIGRGVDIMVPPHKLPEFKSVMKNLSINAEVFIANVQENIDNENPTKSTKAFDWTSYGRYADINEWLDSIVQQYTQVTALVGGTSFEGREIRGVKVSYKAGNKGVFIEGGIHAREWIAPATVTFILNQLLTSTDAGVRNIAENYDWYIFPSVNPDGYEYSHTSDRLWRKTRSHVTGAACYGADPNRNWGFHWLGGGSSTLPCSDTYAGSSAFSEVETRTLSEYITTVASNIHVYLAFHSYSQYLLIPYGITEETIPNFNQHVTVGQKAIAALAQRYNTRYVTGNIVDLLYVASGGSMDWVKGTYNPALAYTFELRDTGSNGFILPANQIIPTGLETLDAVVSILTDAQAIPASNK